MTMGGTVLLALFGMLLGVRGYGLFRVLLWCLGAVAGAAGGSWAGYLMAGDPGSLIGLFIGGAVGGGLSAFTIDLALFLFGWKIGCVVGALLGSPLGPAAMGVAAIVCGVLVGILALRAQRLVIVVGTAFMGMLIELDVLCRVFAGDQGAAFAGLFRWLAGYLPGVSGAEAPTLPTWVLAVLGVGLMFLFVAVQLRELRRRERETLQPAMTGGAAATGAAPRRFEISGAYYERGR